MKKPEIQLFQPSPQKREALICRITDDLDRVNGKGRGDSSSFARPAKERSVAALWQNPVPGVKPSEGIPPRTPFPSRGGHVFHGP